MDASSESAVNTGDPHYQSGQGSGSGRPYNHDRYRGRVVLIVGGEATAFDTTYTSHSGSYSTSVIDSNSHDFVVG